MWRRCDDRDEDFIGPIEPPMVRWMNEVLRYKKVLDTAQEVLGAERRCP